VCIMVKKTGYKPSTAQSYNDFMGGVHSSDAMMNTCTDERIRVKYWKKICFYILSRMVLNSSITYKESKSVSRLDCTVKITDALSEEWLQEKNNAAGISGTGNEETDSKHLKKLPAKKQKDLVCVCVCVCVCVWVCVWVCVCVRARARVCGRCSSSNKRTKHKPLKRQRSRKMCIKCEKGLHGQCVLHHKYTN
jgi:hypothetical protein